MKIIVKGIVAEYSDEGSGPVILMLHGWGDSRRSFDALVPKFSGYRLIRLDLPGFGGTEIPEGAWSVEDFARFVADFCEKAAVVPEFVVGHSLGGRILIKGLGNGILFARKLVLIASAGVADRPTVHLNTYMALAKIGKVLLKPFPKRWYLNLRKELYRVTGGDYISTGALKETFIKVINEDLSEDAKRIAIPALLIWGKDDIVTPVSEGRKFHDLIHGSELKILPDAGHFVHQQKADAVAELVKKFLV